MPSANLLCPVNVELLSVTPVIDRTYTTPVVVLMMPVWALSATLDATNRPARNAARCLRIIVFSSPYDAASAAAVIVAVCLQ